MPAVPKKRRQRLTRGGPPKGVNTPTFPDTQNRNNSQFWVFHNKESAIKQSRLPALFPQLYDSAFNLTITYRRDSDVVRK